MELGFESLSRAAPKVSRGRASFGFGPSEFSVHLGLQTSLAMPALRGS